MRSLQIDSESNYINSTQKPTITYQIIIKKNIGAGRPGRAKDMQQPAQIVTNVALIKCSPFTFVRLKVNKVES